MDNEFNSMTDPLTGRGGTLDDSMSQSSQQSRSKLSGSLLDRIKAQRSRVQSATGIGSNNNAMSSSPMEGGVLITAPSQISIPSYNPIATHPRERSGDLSELGSSSMFSSAWGGFASANQHDDHHAIAGSGMGGAEESLLQRHEASQYSMSQYFQTFVMDVYNIFQRLPRWMQLPLIALMIFLVFKLI